MLYKKRTLQIQIQTLERDLGLKLFTRVKKRLKPTLEGKEFYEHAINYVQGIDNLFENFQEFTKRKKSDTISIGGNVSICYILPKYIQKFEKENPQTKFEIKNLVKKDALQRLINDEMDILIYSMTPEILPPELDFIPLIEYQPVLLTNKKHPLVKKKNVTMKDIKQYKLLRLDPQFITASNFEEIAKRHDLKTKIDFEMANYEIIKKFVKADVGIAVVSGICLEDEGDKHLVGRDMSKYFPSLTYGIVIKKGKIPHLLLQKFIDMLQKTKLLNAKNLTYLPLKSLRRSAF